MLIGLKSVFYLQYYMYNLYMERLVSTAVIIRLQLLLLISININFQNNTLKSTQFCFDFRLPNPSPS